MKARYLFPDDYMADLSVHVFNGRLYISPSHDIETDVYVSGKACFSLFYFALCEISRNFAPQL